MKKLHFQSRPAIAALFSIAIVLLFARLVIAQNSTIIVQIGPLVIDVCPNILGVQSSVPVGMVINGDGDCVTPPPPVVDVCNNIAGDQTTIPAGYYRDVLGDCYVQIIPPVDVCPNLYGIQATVPSSLIVDVNGDCIAPPVDECPTIDGPQSTIPEGMVKVGDVCFTPAPIEPPAGTPNDGITVPSGTQQPPRQTPDYKNVPDILDPLFEPLVNLVPDYIKEAVKSVPEDIARTVPYYIYALLGISTMLMAGQTLREMHATRILILLLKREKAIAEQKDNFIALASHYLRTPLTLMRNGLDTIIALKELTSDKLAPLRISLVELDEDINNILKDIEDNKALKQISAPPAETQSTSIIRSAYFWLPIVMSLLFTWLANFLLGIVANVDLGTANLLFQVIVIVSVSTVFYLVLRNHRIRTQQKKQQQTLIDNEHAIDTARNDFIKRATTALQIGLVNLAGSRNKLEAAPSIRFFDEGYNRFNAILERFLLLGQIQAGSTISSEPVDLGDVINSAIASIDTALKEKAVTITNDIKGAVEVKQNRDLLEFVIKSVLDNAVKFSNSGGAISVKADPNNKLISIEITDDGVGIPKDKLIQLFKPFSRADSAIQFNYEGLGFSLFLDKIITQYMGGDIQATSSQGKGTKVVITTAPTRAI